MIPYFESDDNKKKLLAELERWVGTAFMYNCSGFGKQKIVADCASFPINVFKNLGLIPKDFDPPRYCSVRSRENELIKIYDVAESIINLFKQWEKGEYSLSEITLLCGDMIICSTGRAVQHILIVGVNGEAWHCWPNQGVCKIALATKQVHTLARRVYRFYV